MIRQKTALNIKLIFSFNLFKEFVSEGIKYKNNIHFFSYNYILL